MNGPRRITPTIPNAALMLLPSAFVLPLLIMLHVIDIDQGNVKGLGKGFGKAYPNQ